MQVEAAEHGALSYQLAGLRPFINNPQPEAGNRHLMLDFRAMKLPPADLSYVLEQFDELTEQLDDLADIDPSDSDSPIQLREAMRQLLSLLARLGEDRSAIDHPGELTGYGEYGIHILDQLADVADEVERPDLRQTAEQLSLPFALWVVRNGGELRQLGTVVNALSHLANHSRDPATMANLYGFCCELIEAASPSYEKAAASKPAEPWRLLLLNRAIVATHSRNPELMEPAFDAVVEQLPADTEVFFAEGMEQVTVMDYPDPVRDIVRRYFLAHSKPRHLH
jgi:hypothetical protein